MEELFEKEGCSIFCFKKGDIIIRLKPMMEKKTIYNANLGTSVEIQTGEKDKSFRKRPGEFVGIENNLIYIKTFLAPIRGSVCVIPIEEGAEDWALFVVPEGLTLEDCL